MPSQVLSNPPTKTGSSAVESQPPSKTFPPTKQKVVRYKSSTTATATAATTASFRPYKMAANSPVQIGTRGIVGSLIMQEIEYFSRLQLQISDVAAASNSSHPRPKLGTVVATPKRKKRGSSSGRLIPSMCAVVEVETNNQRKLVSGFSYTNLKTDV